MQRKRDRFCGIGAVIGMLVLIFDSRHALEGARSALELCLSTVIPSLFPFFLLSTLLTNALGNETYRFLGPLSKAFGIPRAAESIWIPSFLGGYPVGAKCAGDLYQSGQISRKEAERLLAFCNNVGPAFLFGMVAASFPERYMVWLLWIIHILSALLTAAFTPVEKSCISAEKTAQIQRRIPAVASAAKAMCLVCCWVVLFRIIITFLNVWFLWMFPQWLQTLLIGILELTNGCCELLRITDVRLRFIVCSCILALGGVCVLFQTASVTPGISIGYYIKGKLMQTAFSALISCAIMLNQGLFVPALTLFFLYVIRKMKNGSRNPRSLPV